MTNYLENKVIVITGAANGFGRLVAHRAAELGAHIVASDINLEALTASVEAITSSGQQAIAVEADVTQQADMRAVVAQAVAHFGRVDCLLNNAGIMPLAYYADHEQAHEAWDKCVDINFKGVVHGINAVYDQMMQQGEGQIINMSSIYGNHPVPGAAVYGATKAAVNFLSESLRQESQGRIKVTTVRPTGVPLTGIGSAIINVDATSGSIGANAETFGTRFNAMLEGTAQPEWLDADSPEYFMLEPERLAEQIIHVINQPMGVSIGDITVRATGDLYII